MLNGMKRNICAAVLTCVTFASALAGPVAEFYQGKTVTVFVGYSVGGGYDLYARTIARFIGKHIPGNPAVLVENMPGAGSLKAANYIYNVAKKDGTAFGMFARGLPMEPLIGSSPTNYDATKFSWVGSATDELSVCATWHTTGIKTWDDLMSKPLTVAGEGTGADPDIYAIVIKNVFDAKLRLVSGYPGAAEMSLAIERGEVDGRCGWSWSTIKSLKPEWIKDKKLNIIVQLSERKSAELPDVPTVMEYADSERHRQILRLITSRQIMGRLFAAPPGLPADRKAALRRAFDETMKDPEFLAEAKAAKLEVNPISGEELDKLIGELYQTPPDVIEEARVVIAKGAR